MRLRIMVGKTCFLEQRRKLEADRRSGQNAMQAARSLYRRPSMLHTFLPHCNSCCAKGGKRQNEVAQKLPCFIFPSSCACDAEVLAYSSRFQQSHTAGVAKLLVQQSSFHTILVFLRMLDGKICLAHYPLNLHQASIQYYQNLIFNWV